MGWTLVSINSNGSVLDTSTLDGAAVTNLLFARAEVERLTSERAATLTEHGELLEQAQGMAEELEELLELADDAAAAEEG